MGIPFTPEEDAVIVRYYQTKPLKWIAQKLGRPAACVVSHSHVLERRGLCDPAKRYCQKPWTVEDEGELRGRWGWELPAAVAKALHRTKTAVILKAKRFGLTRQWKGKYTASAVGRIFDVDAKTVVIWMEHSWLRGRKSPVGAGRNRRWEIKHEALEAFIAAHPDRYDRKRIQEEYWRRLADAAVKDDEWLLLYDAAKALGVVKGTLQRHIQRGWLPGRRVVWSGGFAWQVPRSVLATFRRRHTLPLACYAKGQRGARRLECAA